MATTYDPHKVVLSGFPDHLFRPGLLSRCLQVELLDYVRYDPTPLIFRRNVLELLEGFA